MKLLSTRNLSRGGVCDRLTGQLSIQNACKDLDSYIATEQNQGSRR